MIPVLWESPDPVLWESTDPVLWVYDEAVLIEVSGPVAGQTLRTWGVGSPERGKRVGFDRREWGTCGSLREWAARSPTRTLKAGAPTLEP